MKGSSLGWFILMLLIALGFAMWSRDGQMNDKCKKYGSEWEYRGGYDSYCVNPNGDIKGI